MVVAGERCEQLYLFLNAKVTGDKMRQFLVSNNGVNTPFNPECEIVIVCA